MRQYLNKSRAVIAIFAIALSLGGAVACGEGSEDGEGREERLKIVASTYPMEYFTAIVGGERVEVQNIVPAGGEAHDFEPTPGDLRDIARADVIVYNGLGFETWVGAVLDGGDAPAVAIKAGSESVALRFESDDLADEHDEDGDEHDESGAGALDPHLWLDPVRAITQVREIESGLTGADPDGASVYRANADDLVGELQALDRRFSAGLAGCELDVAITSHDSFNYLADQYGINALGISGINPDAEPSPKTLANLSDIVTETGIEHILVSPIDSERLSGTLMRETGAQALPLHSLQNLTADERESGKTYFTLMESNLESLMTALLCDR